MTTASSAGGCRQRHPLLGRSKVRPPRHRHHQDGPTSQHALDDRQPLVAVQPRSAPTQHRPTDHARLAQLATAATFLLAAQLLDRHTAGAQRDAYPRALTPALIPAHRSFPLRCLFHASSMLLCRIRLYQVKAPLRRRRRPALRAAPPVPSSARRWGAQPRPHGAIANWPRCWSAWSDSASCCNRPVGWLLRYRLYALMRGWRGDIDATGRCCHGAPQRRRSRRR
jgi:hypothetical protein